MIYVWIYYWGFCTERMVVAYYLIGRIIWGRNGATLDCKRDGCRLVSISGDRMFSFLCFSKKSKPSVKFPYSTCINLMIGLKVTNLKNISRNKNTLCQINRNVFSVKFLICQIFFDIWTILMILCSLDRQRLM